MTMAQYLPALREQMLCTNDSGATAFITTLITVDINTAIYTRGVHGSCITKQSGGATRRAVPGGRR